MTRKIQQRAKDTQNRILNAARELFSERGYGRATMDEIAARAKANKQRIYAYFGTKQQLFEKVVLKLFEDVDLFSGADGMADCPPSELSERLLAGFMKVHAEHPEFWRLLAWVNLDGDVAVEKLVGARSHENASIREIFERGLASGEIRKMTFHTYLYALLAMSWFYFSNRRTLQRTLSPELYTAAGRAELISEAAALFSHR